MLRRYTLAALYDLSVILTLCAGLTLIILLFSGGQPIPPGNHWYQAALLLIVYAYYLISLLFGGQTIGMKAWRLKMRTPINQRPFWSIHRRWLLFWPAFAIVNWNANARGNFFKRLNAANLQRTAP